VLGPITLAPRIVPVNRHYSDCAKLMGMTGAEAAGKRPAGGARQKCAKVGLNRMQRKRALVVSAR